MLQIHLFNQSSCCFVFANLTVLALFFLTFDPSRPATKTVILLETLAHYIPLPEDTPQGPQLDNNTVFLQSKLASGARNVGQFTICGRVQSRIACR